jgi:hypothetical protein
LEARISESRCPACGAAIACGAEAGEPSCWCFEMPRLSKISGAACLCRECLEKALKDEKAADRYKT